MTRKGLVGFIIAIAILSLAPQAQAQTTNAPAVSADPGAALTVAGRHRIDLKIGVWQKPSSSGIVTGVGTSDVLGGLQFMHYFSESIAMFVAVEGIGSQTGTTVNSAGVFDGTSWTAAMPIGVNWNPFPTGKLPRGIRPYFTTALMPVFEGSVGSFSGSHHNSSGVNSSATAGGQFGGGVDFQVARHCAINAGAAYNWIAGVDMPLGLSRSLSGPEVSISFGFLFGKGR